MFQNLFFIFYNKWNQNPEAKKLRYGIAAPKQVIPGTKTHNNSTGQT